MPDLTLRPVTHADLPMPGDWLAEPHVREWWDAPEAEPAGMRANPDGTSGAARFDMRIGAMARMDYLIGPPGHLGRGLGAAMVRARAEALIEAGAPCIHADPDADNPGSVGAVRRAGFGEVRQHEADGAVTLVYRHPPAGDAR